MRTAGAHSAASASAAAEVPTTAEMCTAAAEMATTAATMTSAATTAMTSAAAASSSGVSRARKDGGQDNNGTEFEL
jgi:hypothetical protein